MLYPSKVRYIYFSKLIYVIDLMLGDETKLTISQATVLLFDLFDYHLIREQLFYYL